MISSPGASILSSAFMAFSPLHSRSRVTGACTLHMGNDTQTIVLIDTNAPVTDRPGGEDG